MNTLWQWRWHRLKHWIGRQGRVAQRVADLRKDKCRYCARPFNSWFTWPGKGDYCWPCYTEHGIISIRPGTHVVEETSAETGGG